MAERRARLVLLALLLGAATLAKIATSPAWTWEGDGSYFVDVARNVAEGHGLETDVSVFHQGYQELPAPSSVYPLWPLVLGASARVLGMSEAAEAVPEGLYLVALALLYLLAERVAERLGAVRLVPRGWPDWVRPGHLLVVIFGCAIPFFRFTSLPNTEALGFSLAFAALLVADEARRGSLAWALVAGALGGAAYLTRSQLVALPVALVAALALASLREPRLRRSAAVCALASAAVVAPWIAHLASLPGGFVPRMLIDFVAYRETAKLPPFAGYVWPDTTGAWLADRLAGLGVAFHPGDPESYLRSFGLAAWLAPLAVLRVAWRRPRWQAVCDPERVVVTATALSGAIALVFTHGAHLQHMPREWLFGARAGLPMVFALVVAAALLLRAGGAWRGVTAALLLLSAGLGVARVAPFVRELSSEPPEAERELFAWIDAQPEPPLILAPQARVFAAHSHGRFHWIHCQDRPEQTRRYLDLFDFDYVVVGQRRARRCRFLDAQLRAQLEPVKHFGRYVVLRPRRDPRAPTPATQAAPPQSAAGLSQR